LVYINQTGKNIIKIHYEALCLLQDPHGGFGVGLGEGGEAGTGLIGGCFLGGIGDGEGLG
jgi:hypothetical protein